MSRIAPSMLGVLSCVAALGVAVPACAQSPAPPSACGAPTPASDAAQEGPLVDLRGRLEAGALRGVNRDVTALADSPTGVYVTAAAGPGVIWIDGTTFDEGTIAVDVCGRDVVQQSFLGLALHRQDDATYEAVYVRPFNFRADDPARHQHAVQYVALPDYDWPRLRQEFPEEFENPVDASVAPAAWIPLRVVVGRETIQIFVGAVSAPALQVRRLGSASQGLVGLWVGNASDGGFANLRVTEQ